MYKVKLRAEQLLFAVLHKDFYDTGGITYYNYSEWLCMEVVPMRKTCSFQIVCFLLTAATFAISGCTLEAPREVGDSCENPSYVWFGGSQEPIMKGENADYDALLAKGWCPIDAPHCMRMLAYDDYDENGKLTVYPEEHYCSDRRGVCPKNSHPYANDCERDFADQCGSHDINCVDPKKGVASGACVDGATGPTCRIDSCLNETVELENGETEVFNLFVWLDGECRTGDQCCGPYCKNCSLATPKAQVCYSDEALLTDCGEGCPSEEMIVCNGVCVNPNTSMVYCGSTQNRDGSCDIHYCKANPGWLNGSCVDGICVARECLAKYHLNKDEKGVQH